MSYLDYIKPVGFALAGATVGVAATVIYYRKKTVPVHVAQAYAQDAADAATKSAEQKYQKALAVANEELKKAKQDVEPAHEENTQDTPLSIFDNDDIAKVKTILSDGEEDEINEVVEFISKDIITSIDAEVADVIYYAGDGVFASDDGDPIILYSMVIGDEAASYIKSPSGANPEYWLYNKELDLYIHLTRVEKSFISDTED